MSHKPLQSCAELFADKGDPWVTREDWLREEKLARIGDDKAADFTKRASVTPKVAKARPEFWEISQISPKSAKALDKERKRENLKLALAGLGACERTIKPIHVEHLAVRECNVRLAEFSEADISRKLAEPTKCEPVRPFVDSAANRASRLAHWRDMRAYWEKSLTRALELGDVMAAEKAEIRIHTIVAEIAKL